MQPTGLSLVAGRNSILIRLSLNYVAAPLCVVMRLEGTESERSRYVCVIELS